MNTNNIVKILEGNYRNKEEKKSGYDLYRQTKKSNYDFEAMEMETKTPLKGYADYNDLDALEREVRAIHGSR